MKKKYTLIICSILICSFLNTSANTYLNKKNIFRYELGIWHPAIFGMKGVAMPTIKNGISYERIISRTVSINFGYNRLDMIDNAFRKKHSTYQMAYLNPVNTTHIINARYSSNNFEFGIKKYIARRNLLVPIGSYVYFGLIYKFEQTKSNAFMGDYNNSTYYLDTYKANMHDVAFSIAYGNNSIYLKNLVVGYEFKISVPFAAGALRDLTTSYGQTSNYQMENIDLNIVTKRRIIYNIFTLKFSFGIIK